MAAKKPITIAIVYTGVFFASMFIAALMFPKGIRGSIGGSIDPVTDRPTYQADMSWKHWEDYNPEWEEFKDAHSHEFKYWETEIYRGGKRSVNRFFAKK